MRTKSARATNIPRIIIFILLPVVLVVLMYLRIYSILDHMFEMQIVTNANYLNSMASQQIHAKMDDIRNTAEFFRDGSVKEEEMGAVMERLLTDEKRTAGGIVRLDGSPVSGVNLHTSEYIGIQNTFRGKGVVTYRKGEGFLFTAPIYNGENVKYALYEFFDPSALFSGYNDVFYDGEGEMVIVDSSKQTVFPISEHVNPEMFFDEGMRHVYKELNDRMGTGTSAAVFVNDRHGQNYFYVTQLEQNNLYLLGYVSFHTVGGNVVAMIMMVFFLYFLLLALLLTGTLNIVHANAKVRESEELRVAKQIAEESSRSKSEFLAKMTHELRTPINVILGMNEMILREAVEDDIRERAMDIRSAAQILLGLINDVLDFSKIESGNMTAVSVEYDFIAMLRDFIILTENRARQKSLSFEIKVQPDLPVGLYGDDVHIRQVVTNLLTNAVKYTPDGSVLLKISGEKLSEDTVHMRFEVKDTGIGIKPEDIEKLIIPYKRFDEEHNRGVEGTGLGMSIITNLLNLMGSSLHVDSTYGEGSVFYFDLDQKIVDPTPVGDIHQRMNDMVKEYVYHVAFVAPKARVLMVDDNAMNRSIFASLLKKTKISVLTVSSGIKCLEITKEEHFDIIFMDYLMPEMDGCQTMLKLHEQTDGKCVGVPVIALTANAFVGDREKYMEMGFDDFLAKPIVPEKLEQMIREYLPEEYIEETGEAEAVEPREEEDFAYPAIEGVNWEYATLHIKDRDMLMHSLYDYYKNIDLTRKNVDELKDKVVSEDAQTAREGLEYYRIRVHDLKSVSAMMGIMSVSELAKLLEKAAREEDVERIKRLHPVLLDELSHMHERMHPFLHREEEKTLLTDAEHIVSLLEMLRFSVEQMDIGGADNVMEQIMKHAYEDEIQEAIDRLKAETEALDYEAAAEDIEKLIERLH